MIINIISIIISSSNISSSPVVVPQAMSWFRNNVAVYVLSLPQSKQRRARLLPLMVLTDLSCALSMLIDLRLVLIDLINLGAFLII